MQSFYDFTFIDYLIVVVAFAGGFAVGHYVFPWLFGDRNHK